MKATSHPFKTEEIGENLLLTLYVRKRFLKSHKFWCDFKFLTFKKIKIKQKTRGAIPSSFCLFLFNYI
ncbi:hypothetical protein BFR36_06875 [Brochothrix thermosphacta]|uniref:Uncharacterized protein n=1 Tax=Brochothrix thermosphacta TaxID=2756 RepID=A0A1D2L975_BROTH|nr:hypothetical protein CNY62_04620 [Brochothrix thermosphacta]ATH85069.1 hypothetical protein CPF12_04190 [Brochothrix thermosphacta]ODJ66525.1 hypothetical protein BFR36_06875 [Brochothrix thermosphacta]